jgi:solute carrier family 7 (cationic amino acid transporter), member 3
VYSYVSVGEFIAFTIGWNLILEYVIGGSSVARGLSGYIDSLFDYRMGKFWTGIFPMEVDFLANYPDPLSFGIVAVLTVILAAGVKESSLVHTFFTTVNMLTIVVVLVAGILKVDKANWAISKEDIPENIRGGEGGFMPYGIAGVMAGAAKCFYGFVGFDCVATAGEEAKNAKRNIPLAVIFTLFICVIVYILISTILTMMWPYYDQDPEAPLPHIFQQIEWIEIKWTVSIGAIFALFSSLLGALYSLPRVLYAMANDGVLFRFMSRVHPKTKTPVVATLLSGFFSAVMAAIFSLQQLVDMLSIGTLLAYTIVAVSVLVLRYDSNELVEDDERSTKTFLSLKHFFGFNFKKKPSKLSSSVSKVFITIFSLLTIILSCLISFFDFSAIIVTLASTIGALMVLIVIAISMLPTDKSKTISFKVPFVPLLPCFSIFCNTYLMLQLDGATWIRFGGWLFIGENI